MLKSIYGFDPEVFQVGNAIKITDTVGAAPKGVFKSFEFEDDYFHKDLNGNYLVRACYVTELWLTDTYGNECKIPLKHINGDKPRLIIEIIGK